MKAWMKNIKLIVAMSSVLVVFASVSVAYGGLRWAGFDPELMVNDDKVNIYIEWPAEYTCDIEDIDIRVVVPRGSEVTMGSESSGDFMCDGEMITLASDTEVVERGRAPMMRISGRIDADERFPMRLHVYVNDQLDQICVGRNNKVHCVAIRL